MQVLNVHSRKFKCSEEEAGQLLLTLATPEDQIWPSEQWPKIKLDTGYLGAIPALHFEKNKT